MVTQRDRIIVNYLRGWFLCDLVSSLPYEQMLRSNEYGLESVMALLKVRLNAYNQMPCACPNQSQQHAEQPPLCIPCPRVLKRVCGDRKQTPKTANPAQLSSCPGVSSSSYCCEDNLCGAMLDPQETDLGLGQPIMVF